ncbi:hypothetical protein BKP54_21380 [Ensifer sp. 1H6]|nr:hypothetical protein BKP54_21380 [Ensifer sp. 1H6]
MNVVCFGKFAPGTYQAYLAMQNLKNNIAAAGLIPGYAQGIYVALLRDLEALPEQTKGQLCVVFQDRVPISSL